MTTDPQPTEAIIRAVAAAISRAEIHDDRMTSDPVRIRVWADACAKYGIDDTSIACRAVDHHYEHADPDTLRVGVFIAHYRRIRGNDAEREKGQQIAAQLTPPDPQLDGLPIAGADGKPIWAAYEHYDAIELPCETCGAQPEQACINPITNQTRKIPCVSRVATGVKRSRNTP